jgi:hypothetical protein
VHVGYAGTPEIPKISQLSEVFSAVVFTAGLIYTHGVKMFNTGEQFGLIAVTTDNAAAVAEYTNDAAVFPVGTSMFVREFQNTKKIVYTILGDLKFNAFFVFGSDFCLLFQVRNKARPRAGFQLVQ